MAKMHGKNLFAGIIPVKGFFVFDTAPTREIEEPFRQCRRSLIIHHWPGKAIVLGKWGKEAPEDTEQQKILEALGGRKYETTETGNWQGPEEHGPEADRRDMVYTFVSDSM